MKWTRRVLGHSLLRSLVRSLAPFTPSLALHCLLARSAALIRSLAHSLTHSEAHGKEVYVDELDASNS